MKHDKPKKPKPFDEVPVQTADDSGGHAPPPAPPPPTPRDPEG